MSSKDRQPGRLRKAPENFLAPDFLRTLRKEGLDEQRRAFMRRTFMAASAAMAAPVAALGADDPDIVDLPPWSKALGKAGWLSAKK